MEYLEHSLQSNVITLVSSDTHNKFLVFDRRNGGYVGDLQGNFPRRTTSHGMIPLSDARTFGTKGQALKRVMALMHEFLLASPTGFIYNTGPVGNDIPVPDFVEAIEVQHRGKYRTSVSFYPYNNLVEYRDPNTWKIKNRATDIIAWRPMFERVWVGTIEIRDHHDISTMSYYGIVGVFGFDPRTKMYRIACLNDSRITDLDFQASTLDELKILWVKEIRQQLFGGKLPARVKTTINTYVVDFSQEIFTTSRQVIGINQLEPIPWALSVIPVL